MDQSAIEVLSREEFVLSTIHGPDQVLGRLQTVPQKTQRLNLQSHPAPDAQKGPHLLDGHDLLLLGLVLIRQVENRLLAGSKILKADHAQVPGGGRSGTLQVLIDFPEALAIVQKRDERPVLLRHPRDRKDRSRRCEDSDRRSRQGLPARRHHPPLRPEKGPSLRQGIPDKERQAENRLGHVGPDIVAHGANPQHGQQEPGRCERDPAEPDGDSSEREKETDHRRDGVTAQRHRPDQRTSEERDSITPVIAKLLGSP